MKIKIKRELIKLLWSIFPKTIEIKINKNKFKIPLQYSLDHRVIKHNREIWMEHIIKLIYKHSKGAFIDIGANAGQTLLKVQPLISPREYIGFEPNAYCAGYVHQIIQVNHFENCTIFPIGLGDKDTILPLFCHNRADPTGTVVENFRAPDPSLSQQLAIIQEAGKFLESLHVQEIAVVKIDVEGYEASVLFGLREILRQQRPFVICEILRTHHSTHPSYAFRMKSRQICEDLLHEMDYSILMVKENNSLEPCERISNISTNYVFAPRERENVLKNVSGYGIT
jgi:FkbM family methyltransferase